MESSHRIQRIGTAHLALGCWLLVATIAACVTSVRAESAARPELAKASMPVVMILGTYLALTATFHLGIGRRLRQDPPSIPHRNFAGVIDHVLILLLIVKVSLRNPSSPVYLAGLETLLAVIVTGLLLSLTAWAATWFVGHREQLDSRGETLENTGDRALSPFDWLTALQTILAIAALAALWWLNGQPLETGE